VQIEGLTTRFGRWTVPLEEMVTAIGVALAGRASSGWPPGRVRLPAATHCCAWWGSVRSRGRRGGDTGVDDFALRGNRR
jgi:hypothetical protein